MAQTNYTELVAHNVKAEMERQGITGLSLAERVAIPQSTMSRLLISGDFYVSQLQRIAKALGTETTTLMQDAA